MRISTVLIATVFILVTGGALAQSVRVGPDGFSFRFGRDDRRGDVEGKCAPCEVYSRIAVIQADANERFRCGLQGPLGRTIPRVTSSGVGMCRGSGWPKNSATALKNCSIASIGSAISTMTAGGADRTEPLTNEPQPRAGLHHFRTARGRGRVARVRRQYGPCADSRFVPALSTQLSTEAIHRGTARLKPRFPVGSSWYGHYTHMISSEIDDLGRRLGLW
jgi:hypothetical protein